MLKENWIRNRIHGEKIYGKYKPDFIIEILCMYIYILYMRYEKDTIHPLDEKERSDC